MSDETIPPCKHSPAIALVFFCATDFAMSLPIRLNSVIFGALLALVFLLAVLSTKVLLNPRQIPQCPGRIMVDTGRLWAYIHFLPHFLG